MLIKIFSFSPDAFFFSKNIFRESRGSWIHRSAVRWQLQTWKQRCFTKWALVSAAGKWDTSWFSFQASPPSEEQSPVTGPQICSALRLFQCFEQHRTGKTNAAFWTCTLMHVTMPLMSLIIPDLQAVPPASSYQRLFPLFSAPLLLHPPLHTIEYKLSSAICHSSPFIPSQTFSHPLLARSHSPEPSLQEKHMPGVCLGEALQFCMETKGEVCV